MWPAVHRWSWHSRTPALSVPPATAPDPDGPAPHTATAVGAANKTKSTSDIIVLGTAHPYKFLKTIKIATGKEIDPPEHLTNLLNKEEKYDILENNVLDIKKYILERVI